jgi:hypothetical protein
VLRTLYTHRQISRQRKWVTTEINALKRKIEQLENKHKE